MSPSPTAVRSPNLLNFIKHMGKVAVIQTNTVMGETVLASNH